MKIGVGLALAALLWAPAGCKHKRREEPAAAQAGRVPSVVKMGDPNVEAQLTSGFYTIEDGAWRWTAKQFVVEIGTPPGAATRGATLELQVTVPPVAIEKNGAVTLSASVDGNVLPPETYSQAGQYVYKRDVPAALLGAPSVKAAFEVDKTLMPGGQDQRVLGVIATSAALVAK